MRIDLDLDDGRAVAAINRLLAAGEDLSPLMRDVGEILLNSTRDRFDAEKGPDGTPWAPLSATTLARKPRNRDKVLTEFGDLRGTLAYQAGSDFVEIGSPRVYAGTHQFGAARGEFGTTSRGAPIPWGDIPARPFLGLDVGSSFIVRDAMNDYLVTQW